MKDIWQNLYEYFIVETEADPRWNEDSVNDFMTTQLASSGYNIVSVIFADKQQLTHQTIHGYFITVTLTIVPAVLLRDEYRWLSKKQISRLAFPSFINQHFQNKDQPDTLFVNLSWFYEFIFYNFKVERWNNIQRRLKYP